MKKVIICAGLLFLTVTGARAEGPANYSAYWLKECQRSGFDCLSFIFGMTEGLHAALNATREAGMEISALSRTERAVGECGRADLPVEAHRQIWVRYLLAHKESLQLRASETYIAAHREMLCKD